jgi:hypothetical protein
MSVEHFVEYELAGETDIFGEKYGPSVSLSTTNPTRPGLGLNPGCRVAKPATNPLRYGKTLCSVTLVFSAPFSSAGATVYDDPWPLLRFLAIGSDHVTFVSNF